MTRQPSAKQDMDPSLKTAHLNQMQADRMVPCKKVNEQLSEEKVSICVNYELQLA